MEISSSESKTQFRIYVIISLITSLLSLFFIILLFDYIYLYSYSLPSPFGETAKEVTIRTILLIASLAVLSFYTNWKVLHALTGKLELKGNKLLRSSLLSKSSYNLGDIAEFWQLTKISPSEIDVTKERVPPSEGSRYFFGITLKNKKEITLLDLTPMFRYKLSPQREREIKNFLDAVRNANPQIKISYKIE